MSKPTPAGVLIDVELITADHDSWSAHLSRVPCVGEFIFDAGRTFVVKQVFHPLDPNDRPLIRVSK